MKANTRHRSARSLKPSQHSPVSPEWAWHYRTLVALRDYLRGSEGDRLRECVDPLEPGSLHAEDLVDECYDRDLARALPCGRGDALQEIEAALQRIRDGTYGRCARTHRPIPKRQLLLMPWRRESEPKPARNASA